MLASPGLFIVVLNKGGGNKDPNLIPHSRDYFHVYIFFKNTLTS